MAVQRVWDGERPSVVIASYGFSRPVIYKWLRQATGKGHGLRRLRSRKGTGRPPKLTTAQGQQVFRWINGKIHVNMDLILICGRVESLPS